MHAHALACTHGRHACTQTERVLRCENRRAKSGQWRAEAGIGGVTHVVNERPIRAPSPADFELVSRSVYTAFAFARERDGQEKEGEEKKAGECTREQGESHEFAKEEEREGWRWQRRKRRRETSLHRVSAAPYPGRQRGEGERQKEGHNMPNERAPWTSCYSLAKEKRAWKEGASSSQGEKKREREEGGNSLDTLRVDVRERDRLGERARPLNLEQFGESHFCEDTPAGLSTVVGFCDRAADGQPPEARQIRATAPRLSRQRDRRRKVEKEREREKEKETAHTVVAYPRIERLAVGQLRREEASSGKQKKVPSPSRTDLVAEVVQGPRAFSSRVCSP